jgi:hypothetical protein
MFVKSHYLQIATSIFVAIARVSSGSADLSPLRQFSALISAVYTAENVFRPPAAAQVLAALEHLSHIVTSHMPAFYCDGPSRVFHLKGPAPKIECISRSSLPSASSSTSSPMEISQARGLTPGSTPLVCRASLLNHRGGAVRRPGVPVRSYGAIAAELVYLLCCFGK